MNEIQRTLEELYELEAGPLTVEQERKVKKAREEIEQLIEYYKDRKEKFFKIGKRIGKLEKYWFGFSKETDTNHGGVEFEDRR